MQIEEIINIVNKHLPESEATKLENCKPEGFEVNVKYIVPTMKILQTSEALYFDMLSCLTGIDNGPQLNTMEIIYHLFSIPYEKKLTVKATIPRDNPQVDSISFLWQTANWHEREAYDLLGIYFVNHPDLRRILLPDDWIGHPLRRDYTGELQYHGLHIPYDRKEQPTENIGSLSYPDALTNE